MKSRGQIFNIIPIAVLLLFSTVLLFKPLTDSDLGWHLKYGQIIYNTHTVPQNNLFSYTFADYKWANSYWLSELIMFVLFNINPAFISIIFSIILTAVIYTLINLMVKNNSYLNLFGFLMGLLPFYILMSYFTVTIRPLFISSVFLPVVTYILLYKKERIYLLPFIFLFWANMHADFVLGLGIVFLFSFFHVVSISRSKLIGFNINEIPGKALLFLSCLSATLINPFGINLWATLLKETHFFQFGQIKEWLPFYLANPSAQDITVFVIIFIIFLLPVITSFKKHGVWFGLLHVFLILMCIRFVYFFRISSLILIFPMVEFYSGFLRHPFYKSMEQKFSLILTAFAVFAIFILSLQIFFFNLKYYVDPQALCNRGRLPCESLAYVKEHSPDGNMFNDYNWGGFLIYSLPEYKTFVDGRMTSWRSGSKSVFEDYVKMYWHPAEHDDLVKYYLNTFNIKWGIFDNRSGLAGYLKDKYHWKVLYENSTQILMQGS